MSVVWSLIGWNYIRDIKKIYVYIAYPVSLDSFRRQFKSFLTEYREQFILGIQNHGSWSAGETRIDGINNLRIKLINLA